MEGSWRSLRALVACTLIVAGCQVRGLVGSNESADGKGTDGSGSADEGSGGGDVETEGGPASDGTRGASASGGAGSGITWGRDDGSSSGGDPFRFDVAPRDDTEACAPPSFPSCDGGRESDLLWQHAIGFCDADAAASFEQNTPAEAVAFVEGRVGAASSPYAPREGQRMLVLSTGDASEFAMTPAQIRARHPLECEDPLQCPSTDLGGARMNHLPEPLDWRPVHDQHDCGDDPGLVGRGDCSNSLFAPWLGGDGAFDYGELRLTAEVPRFTDALAFDFAFFSSEYPLYTGSAQPFNDMFVAWLESEAWTGNVSFDDALQPITAQSVFMDHRSASPSCPGCVAPELEGFSMEHHGGTRWLRTTAPVMPGETIELVFSVFDLSDASMDSMVLLDGFEWSCSSSPPITTEG